MEGWASSLEENEPAGADVLRVIANEEAGKFLILVDAARCPLQPAGVWQAHLDRFGSHLAKGLYVEACRINPASLGELLDYLEGFRKSHYLDGPNDVDWIFRNRVEARREEQFYVDYVETEEGTTWWSPRTEVPDLVSFTSRAVEVVRSLVQAGVSSAAGLKIVADIWRPFSVSREARWGANAEAIRETIEALQQAGAMQSGFERPSMLTEAWPFPLYGCDLSMIDVSVEELEAAEGTVETMRRPNAAE